jgi:hypothetical protein
LAIKGDEYEQWQRNKELSDANVRNPLEYWAKRQDRYPRLARMAMDFLIIPLMAAEYKKGFSAAGKMVMVIRNRLDTDIIGICQIFRL